jgi:hypothetical protein
MTPGQTVAAVIGSTVALFVVAVAVLGRPTQQVPKPGERRYGYRGKEFRIYPASYMSVTGPATGYELDIGDELHVGAGGGRHFVSTTQALKFAHKRIDSDQPPKFY